MLVPFVLIILNIIYNLFYQTSCLKRQFVAEIET